MRKEWEIKMSRANVSSWSLCAAVVKLWPSSCETKLCFSYCSVASFRKFVSCKCSAVNWFQHNQCSLLVTKQCLLEVQLWAEQDVRCLRKVYPTSLLDSGKKQMWESVPKIPIFSAVSLQLQSDPIFCLRWDLFNVCEGDSKNIHWVSVSL